MPRTRAVIFANGEMPEIAWAKDWISSGDFVIAVDGGLNHCVRLGLPPSLLLGDLDSVTPDQVEAMTALGVRIERFPPAKDETDLELALLWAAANGFSSILIFGALGGRIDHTIANLSLLLLPELAGIDVRIITETDEIFLITREASLLGSPGDVVSLLPWGGLASGVTTHRLQYPLHAATLTPDRSRGVSNVMLESSARVSLEQGSLLCIHSRKPGVSPAKSKG